MVSPYPKPLPRSNPRLGVHIRKSATRRRYVAFIPPSILSCLPPKYYSFLYFHKYFFLYIFSFILYFYYNLFIHIRIPLFPLKSQLLLFFSEKSLIPLKLSNLIYRVAIALRMHSHALPAVLRQQLNKTALPILSTIKKKMHLSFKQIYRLTNTNPTTKLSDAPQNLPPNGIDNLNVHVNSFLNVGYLIQYTTKKTHTQYTV